MFALHCYPSIKSCHHQHRATATAVFRGDLGYDDGVRAGAQISRGAERNVADCRRQQRPADAAAPQPHGVLLLVAQQTRSVYNVFIKSVQIQCRSQYQRIH